MHITQIIEVEMCRQLEVQPENISVCQFAFMEGMESIGQFCLLFNWKSGEILSYFQIMKMLLYSVITTFPVVSGILL